MNSLLRPLFALCLGGLVTLAAPLFAEAPWTAGETLRSEAGRAERLLYRAETSERRSALAAHLGAMQAALAGADPAFGPEIALRLAEFEAQAQAGSAPGTARARQRLWVALTLEAREQAFAAIARGDAATAANWLTLRDYARASGDTAAALAVQALGQKTMAPEAVRQTVEGELLTVAASELRLALRRATEDAAAGHAVQFAGGLGRIEGLLAYLGGTLEAALGADGMAALGSDLARAETDPAALAQIEARLAGYAPVALSDEEVLRRARLLRRFTALVWEEYKDGVRDGEISQPLEYNEARLFADRAVMILSDLAPQMPDQAAAERLAGLLAAARERMAQKADGIEPLIAEAVAEIDRSFGAAVAAGGYAAALDALPAALDELALMAQSGDWSGAALKRLEAYAWFDPDIEQRLVPRAPTMALRIEARFWEGTAARPGLGTLIAQQADLAQLAAEIDGIKSDLVEAKARIEVQPTPLGSTLQSAGILFREGLEAVLILAALLAALRAEGLAPARFRPALSLGVGLAFAGSFALWGATRWLFSLSTLAREALEGATALLAAVVLIWMVLGLGGGGGHVAAFRSRLARVASPVSVGVLAFLVVFREGFETVLFYEALLVDAARGPVLAGLALGAGAVLAAGWAVFASGRKLPLRLFFRATTLLLAALSVMLVGAGVRGLQTAALLSATPVSWFPDADWLQLWFGLFPVAEPLAAQAVTLAILLMPWRRLPQSLRSRGALRHGS